MLSLHCYLSALNNIHYKLDIYKKAQLFRVRGNDAELKLHKTHFIYYHQVHFLSIYIISHTFQKHAQLCGCLSWF